ncbi:Alpha/beta hydrolase related protein [Perilla frutescens var. frutescens]|nr:Alpha/beta hydrolase related protein [Perilla frutescens var. frutescens]
MGLSKEEKSLNRATLAMPRWIKTLFFLITMLISLLLFSAPILLIVADALLPSAFLSAAMSPSSLNLQTLSSHLTNYDFRYSLIDIPLVSIVRSAIILCVYSFCDGPRLSRGPYLTIATVCSAASVVFVSLKASYVFMISGGSSYSRGGGGYARAMEVALFVSSWLFAIGHVVVAYRTSCRERRKLLVYKIDIEAGHNELRQLVIDLRKISRLIKSGSSFSSNFRARAQQCQARLGSLALSSSSEGDLQSDRRT